MAASTTALSSISPTALHDAVDGRELRPAGLLAEILEHLLEPLDLLVGLLEMTFQSGDEIAVGRLFDHLGQRLMKNASLTCWVGPRWTCGATCRATSRKRCSKRR
jgi:hypothetical protein